MTLNEYIEKLKVLAKDFGNLPVIYSKDDEGNEFREVLFPPTSGYYEKGNYEVIFSSHKSNKGKNAVCVN